MRAGLIAFLLCCFFGSSFSQGVKSIEGVVKDVATGEVLAYAQIAMAYSTLGTVSNEEGFFRLKMPDAEKPDSGSSDSLLITFLGFQTERISVKAFDSGTLEIFLVPVSLELREVEIIALSPQEVLHRAFDSIPFNYGTDSVILTAFIRTQKTVNMRLAEYTEAIVEDMKTGYSYCTPRASGIRHLTYLICIKAA